MANDAIKQIGALQLKSNAVSLRIVEEARRLVATLKDLNAPNAANRVAELLFEYDAIQGEIEAIVMRDPQALLKEMIDGMRREGPGGRGGGS